VAAARIQAGGRLVEEDHPWRTHERHGEVQPATHATGVGRRRATSRVDEIEALQQLGDPIACRGAVEVVEVGHQPQVLLTGEHVVDRRELAGDADRGPHAVRIVAHVAARHSHLARVGWDQGGQDPHDRRLARPVGPEQREDRALGHGEIDPAEHDDLAEGLA
jgi:hypothetical protein